MRKYYIIIMCGLLIALQVVFGRITQINLVIVRINLVFIPIALGGAIFGPLWNGVICAAADIVNFILFPQGPVLPGFTLSAPLTGFTYGFFLKAPLPFLNGIVRNGENPGAGPLSNIRLLIIRTSMAAFCVTLIIEQCLNTLWVSLLPEMNEAYIYYFMARLPKSLVMLPVHVILIVAIWRPIGKYIESSVIPKISPAREVLNGSKE